MVTVELGESLVAMDQVVIGCRNVAHVPTLLKHEKLSLTRKMPAFSYNGKLRCFSDQYSRMRELKDQTLSQFMQTQLAGTENG
jgi:hypothetical protein